VVGAIPDISMTSMGSGRLTRHTIRVGAKAPVTRG
jgi:hypothetical protein